MEPRAPSRYPTDPDDAAPREPLGVRSLRELLERASGRRTQLTAPEVDAGLAEVLPFPFMALVGQIEMKLALLLALINPALGGVLLIGPRGVGKTTAVRSLADLLPQVLRSTCHYGCLPEDIESGGMEAVCPDCARKWGEGLPLAAPDRVRLIELPLNARLEDVIGGLNESGPHERGRLRRGLLAQADRNLLYIDEVNLLPDELIDAILDAAAQGQYTLRRGGVTAVLRSRLMLIGSMNPEEGRLRPQIQDRFGLRVVLDGLTDLEERLEAYRRVQAYLTQPRAVVARFAPETDAVRAEIGTARRLLPSVTIPEPTARIGLQWIARLGIASLRAEISLFEAARAYAAADGRTEVLPADLSAVACMALRARRSTFMTDYAAAQAVEAQEIRALFASEEAPHD